MPEDNGTIEHPTHDLVVQFDPDKQTALLKFDNGQFRNWDYILAVLKMATLQATLQRDLTIQGHMQKQAMQEMALAQQAAQNQRAIKGIISGR